LREKVELWLAWKRVAREVVDGTLGANFDRADRADIDAKVREAEEAAKDEGWGGYRFIVLADAQEPDGLKTIDLGAGHASTAETLCGRIITALKSQALLNESVGAGYIERKWPPALEASGAWPLSSLRQSFLNGSLTRLLDPDTILRSKIMDFVSRGEFGLASGPKRDGTYDRVWYAEPMAPEEVAFEGGVFLLKKAKAELLKSGRQAASVPQPVPGPTPVLPPEPKLEPGTEPEPGPTPAPRLKVLRLVGTLPPEVWNRFGTKVVPMLRSAGDLKAEVDLSLTVDARPARNLEVELRQLLNDLGLADKLNIELP
jgi:hypothetical protein